MFHTIGNVCRVVCGRPTRKKPPKARWVDIFADPGGDMADNARRNEEAKQAEETQSS